MRYTNIDKTIYKTKYINMDFYKNMDFKIKIKVNIYYGRYTNTTNKASIYYKYRLKIGNNHGE